MISVALEGLCSRKAPDSHAAAFWACEQSRGGIRGEAMVVSVLTGRRGSRGGRGRLSSSRTDCRFVGDKSTAMAAGNFHSISAALNHLTAHGLSPEAEGNGQWAKGRATSNADGQRGEVPWRPRGFGDWLRVHAYASLACLASGNMKLHPWFRPSRYGPQLDTASLLQLIAGCREPACQSQDSCSHLSWPAVRAVSAI